MIFHLKMSLTFGRTAGKRTSFMYLIFIAWLHKPAYTQKTSLRLLVLYLTWLSLSVCHTNYYPRYWLVLMIFPFLTKLAFCVWSLSSALYFKTVFLPEKKKSNNTNKKTNAKISSYSCTSRKGQSVRTLLRILVFWWKNACFLFVRQD